MLSRKQKRRYTKGLGGCLSVYLLTTTKSLEEVSKILPELTNNYLPPVILDAKKKYNPLRLAYLEYPSVLFDDKNPIDCQDYAILESSSEFEKYVSEHIEEIREAYPSFCSVKDVCRSIQSRKKSALYRYLPTPPQIPDIMSLSWWTGKIGFIGENDNWEKILERFGGLKLYLGEV